MSTRLVIASDHGGYDLKQELITALSANELTIEDLGTHEGKSVDYPDLAHQLCATILDGKADLGILVCGTGIGMSLAANRHSEIRAALCTDPYMSRMAREHNDANVLCLGGRVIGPSLALEIAQSFLSGKYEGGRHARRVAKLSPA